ncbi:hypothetical protein EYF80_048100 [Liparis tanakae]|uniref:Uncharacterized protein n=1 Tax=Liparis tanakae TaxID=230148 RepID=A0A4Z2FKH7_9TELE|nr:hypothetical protein EYF80_048100 [Liparis tanakae]
MRDEELGGGGGGGEEEEEEEERSEEYRSHTPEDTMTRGGKRGCSRISERPARGSPFPTAGRPVMREYKRSRGAAPSSPITGTAFVPPGSGSTGESRRREGQSATCENLIRGHKLINKGRRIK